MPTCTTSELLNDSLTLLSGGVLLYKLLKRVKKNGAKLYLIEPALQSQMDNEHPIDSKLLKTRNGRLFKRKTVENNSSTARREQQRESQQHLTQTNTKRN